MRLADFTAGGESHPALSVFLYYKLSFQFVNIPVFEIVILNIKGNR